jgi:magnesium-transporting ATPase (P-type)
MASYLLLFCYCDDTGAEIRSVMITGDNIVTACAVAKECQMVRTNETLLLASAEWNAVTSKYELHLTPADGELPGV